MRKITSFNEYRKMVSTGELTFRDVLGGTDSQDGMAIIRKIAKNYDKIIEDGTIGNVHEKELDMIKAMFYLIHKFGKACPEYQDIETEAIFYAMLTCAVEV